MKFNSLSITTKAVFLVSIALLSISAVNSIKLQEKSTLFSMLNLERGKTSTKRASLSDMQVDTINIFAKSVKKYFKDQIPPSDTLNPWTDPLFPPTWGSMISLNPDGSRTDPFMARDPPLPESDVEWKRVKDIFDGGIYALFETNISIHDIRQGGIGNCYFLAAISSLAETPQLILQLFRSFTVNAAGFIEVIARIDGEWQVVIIDDYFPVRRGTNSPIFARPVNAEIWVMILEKVWAKINGGFTNTIGGHAVDVYDAFSNFPSKVFMHSMIQDREEFWRNLATSSNNNDIVTCSSPQSAGGDSDLVDGIVQTHAFSLLKAIEITVGGSQVRLLRIRNPWGNQEWTGKWSDGSPQWTDEAKAAVGDYRSIDDGTFYMDYEDYLAHFVSTTFNIFSPMRITKSYKVPVEDSDKGIVSEFTIHKPSDISIGLRTLNQRTNRHLQRASMQSNMILVKKENGTPGNPETYFKYITAGKNNKSDIVLSQLEVGTYLIYSQTNEESAIALKVLDKAYPYIIEISSTEFFDFTPRFTDTDNSVARLAILDFAKKASKDQIAQSKSSLFINNGFIPSTTLSYFFVINKSTSDKSWKIENQSQNSRVLYPPTEIMNKTFKLAPSKAFISFGPRYNEFSGGSVWMKASSSFTPGEDATYSTAEKAKTNASDDEYARYADGFVFKYLKANVDELYKTIDPIYAAQAHFTAKYPEIMSQLLALPPLNDGVAVKFFERDEVKGRYWIFCEKRLDTQIRHGRTYYLWPNGTRYIGYSKNAKFDGPGTQIDASGAISKPLYDNGKFVKWLN